MIKILRRTLFFLVLAGATNITLAGQSGLPGNIENEDIILHFDQSRIPIDNLNFRQRNRLKPSKNDFRLVEMSFLSNNIGERWAIVTIKNTSQGRRFFKDDNIIATLADGSQSRASGLDEALEGGELLTRAIYFGIHKFPIVKLELEYK
ncbi:hypothetical protein [Sulfuriflexus mobilis]|uniref:hypothetical protein n=1 Tax=Sulfuriflexus mobilis TaxID=1811807 RepID=UPI000F849049|nr:hypothetical protein [Sulfuriflexus mobilis]